MSDETEHPKIKERRQLLAEAKSSLYIARLAEQAAFEGVKIMTNALLDAAHDQRDALRLHSVATSAMNEAEDSERHHRKVLEDYLRLEKKGDLA